MIKAITRLIPFRGEEPINIGEYLQSKIAEILKNQALKRVKRIFECINIHYL